MLIVDMPMPKSCWDCPLSEQIEDWDDFNGSFYVAECKLQYPKVVMIDEHTRIRPDSCPIKGELVLCGECKHRDPEDKRCDCGGHEWVKGKILPVKDDWFCADGKRKEKEECSD